MKIRVIESYDSELGYDEDNYYEINNYRNMVVYAQKNKHHQGLEGITLDFDSLIEDLKKKRVLIKSEFENIKESDLDKHYDYYILPDDFVDDIIVQLGYEPSKERIYKNNEVEYHNEIITDIEFEQRIADEKNEYHWLSKCKFKDAKIKLIEGWSGDNWISFLSGTWINGNWKKGDFEKSIWKNGKWERGWFTNSTWEKGIWENGYFVSSTWQKGNWEKGSFRNSTWEKGNWESGFFVGSTWMDGTWENGDFTQSTWENGLWKHGDFDESTWINGDWEDGTWFISNNNKCTDTAKFQPSKIDFMLDGKIYSFEDIWNSISMLKIIKKKKYMGNNQKLYIGNLIVTPRMIEKRIKELVASFHIS